MISWDNEEIKISECGSLNHFENREKILNESFWIIFVSVIHLVFKSFHVETKYMF